LLLLASGCSATSRYSPQWLARGELTVRYDDHFEMWAAGRRVAHGLAWEGLPAFVRCVPEAEEHARKARHSGRAALALSILGGTLGLAGLGGLAGLADPQYQWHWLGGGLASAALGLGFSIGGQALRNRANGQAIDAMNFYNDAVGSLGATCDDLRYPEPAGPMPAEPRDP
jgi:hypothetical protein